MQSFDKDGNALNQSYQDAASPQNGLFQTNSVAVATAWIGNSYRLVWQDRREALVYMADTPANGSSISAPAQVFHNALTNAGATYAPDVAYDPISGRTLIVYLSDVRFVIGSLYAGSTPIGNPMTLSLAQFPVARSPQVAWHPGYRGWLLSYQDNTDSQHHLFVPLDANGAQVFWDCPDFSDTQIRYSEDENGKEDISSRIQRASDKVELYE